MPRHLIFNVDFEEKLAGRRGQIAPRLWRKLASRFLFLGTGDDTLEGDFELPSDFRRRFSDLPRIVKGGSGERLEWAPSEPAAVVRRVNAKPWSHLLARRLGVAPEGACLLHSYEEAEREVASRGSEERWVMKRAFGHGALGHFLGAGSALPPNARGWIAKALALGEPIVFERWVERDADYSVQTQVAPAKLPRVTELLTTPQGAYVGNRIGTASAQVIGDLQNNAVNVIFALVREGYGGPVGIDAYSSHGVLRPLVEVNARHTMGRIALEIARRLDRPIASWITLQGPLRIDSEGPHWIVTDPWPDEPGPATVFLWAESRAELILREEALRRGS